MSLLKEAYEGLGGLLGSASNTQPNQEEIEKLRKAYEQRAGVMDTPQRESPHYQDQYTPSTFGSQVHMVHGSHPIWNEFGDRTLKTFEKFGLKVDRKNLFPWDVDLSSSADRDIPDGRGEVQDNPHVDSEPKDMYEREWLNKNTGMNWDLGQGGLLRSLGKYNPNENHLAVTRDGAMLSRDFYPGGNDPQTGKPRVYPPWQNVTGHEYGHYLDLNLGDGNGYLSDVVESMINRKPHAMTQENLMELWMRDPRTAHLDMEDQVNVSHHEGRNNPREILGKLYTTALMGEYKNNPKHPFLEDIQENIARALGVFMDDQWSDEGHSQQIKEQRRDVMGALANIFSQTRR